jgi:hypothetical protein
VRRVSVEELEDEDEASAGQITSAEPEAVQGVAPMEEEGDGLDHGSRVQAGAARDRIKARLEADAQERAAAYARAKQRALQQTRKALR